MIFRFTGVLPVLLLLAACAGLQLPGAVTGSGGATGSGGTGSGGAETAPGANAPGQPPDMTNLPVAQKLAPGTLILEGTENAVTAQQAKALLPLWKAARALSRDASAATGEVDGLYQQIEEAMTPAQAQAIKDMSISREEIQALMEQYDLRAQVMIGPNASGTPAARSQNGQNGGAGNADGGVVRQFPQGGGGNAGGEMGGPGVIMGGPPAVFEDGTGPNFQGTPRVQGTPGAGPGNRTFRGGFNAMFIDPLITLLQERSGAANEQQK
jgi:hypothetical protein